MPAIRILGLSFTRLGQGGLKPERIEIRIGHISVDYSSLVSGPLNRESGIVPAYTSSMLRGVDLGHLITDLGVGFERLKAVSESLRHIEHQPILRRQLNRDPLFEGRGVRAEIQNDV